MASRQTTVDYLFEQMAGADASARKMFGEYGIYSGGKMVALVCDDQLFVKPTVAGRTMLGTVVEAAPYPGAKPCFLIDGARWEDADWLAELIRVSAAELAMPAKKRSAKMGRGG